jgi:hypothetical protein
MDFLKVALQSAGVAVALHVASTCAWGSAILLPQESATA